VGERDAVQRTARNPAGNRRIGRRRRGQRFLDFHTDEGIQDRLPALDAREQCARDLNGRQLVLADCSRCFRQCQHAGISHFVIIP
jgi:hypothetical protein